VIVLGRRRPHTQPLHGVLLVLEFLRPAMSTWVYPPIPAEELREAEEESLVCFTW